MIVFTLASFDYTELQIGCAMRGLAQGQDRQEPLRQP
jgi:hypothetical protein